MHEELDQEVTALQFLKYNHMRAQMDYDKSVQNIYTSNSHAITYKPHVVHM